MNDIINKNDTVTGICNSALAAIGHTNFIDDISEDKPVCRSLRIVFDRAVREVQGHANAVWDELCTECDLVKRRDEYGVAEYNLPLDFLNPVSLRGKKDGVRIPFEISGGFLRCESQDIAGRTPRLRYSKVSYNPAEWSTEMKTCIIKLLSARVLASVVKDFANSTKMEQNFWNYEFPMQIGNKRNKSNKTNRRGDDSQLSRYYAQGFEGVTPLPDFY